MGQSPAVICVTQFCIKLQSALLGVAGTGALVLWSHTIPDLSMLPKQKNRKLSSYKKVVKNTGKSVVASSFFKSLV